MPPVAGPPIVIDGVLAQESVELAFGNAGELFVDQGRRAVLHPTEPVVVDEGGQDQLTLEILVRPDRRERDRSVVQVDPSLRRRCVDPQAPALRRAGEHQQHLVEREDLEVSGQ